LKNIYEQFGIRSDGVNLISNDLLADELETERDIAEGKNVRESIDRYSQEDDEELVREQMRQNGLILDLGDGTTLDLEFPQDHVSETGVS
jgi:hypothetical protein